MSDWRKQQAWNHIVSQLHDKPNFEKLVKLIANQSDHHVDILQFLGTLSIDTATNYWLDLIGEIVGQSRFIMTRVKYRYFGAQEGIDHQSEFMSNIGGLESPIFLKGLNSLGETTRLNDDDYRILLYARIARNVGTNTLEGVQRSLKRIFRTTDVLVFNAGNASYITIVGSDVLSDIFMQVIKTIDILPRAAGVGVKGFYVGAENQKFFGAQEGVVDPIFASKIGGLGCFLLEKYKVNYGA